MASRSAALLPQTRSAALGPQTRSAALGPQTRSAALGPQRLRRLCVGAVAATTLLAGACTTGGGVDDPTSGGRLSTSSIPSPSGSTPPTTSGSTSGSGSASGTTPMGAKWDWGRFDAFQPFLESISGGSTYYEVVWCQIEKEEGAPDWSGLDRVAERSRDLGITLMLKLRVGRCWATAGEAQHSRGSKNKTESAMPTDMNAYSAWVKSAVTRYAKLGVHSYAIENEINSKSFWDGTPQDFTRLAETAAAQIRSADPQAKVVDAGLSSTTYGYGLSDWLLKQGRDADAIAGFNSYFERRIGTRGDSIPHVQSRADLERVLQSEQGQRNLSYLGVVRSLAERKITDIRQIHFYEKYTAVPLLLTYLRANTPASTPIEAWEVGNFSRDDTDDSAERTEEVLKTMSLMLAEGLEVAIWLPLAFDPDGRNSDEPRLGLLDPDGKVRDAGRLFQSMLDASRGATAKKIKAGGLTGVGFDKGGRSTAFVWSEPDSAITLSPGETATILGEPGKAASTGRITVGGTPMQLALKRTTATFVQAQQ